MAASRVKLGFGTVYQNTEGGTYFFRYQVDGQRKAVSLQTKNRKDAIQKAKEMELLLKASSVDVVAAHISHVKSWANAAKRLELVNAWDVYDSHPDRARPATVASYQQYRLYLRDLVAWATAKGHTFLDEITDAVAAEYAEVLRREKVSVDTHNKRIARIARVFRTLGEYVRPETSDWTKRGFRRKRREEIGIMARRLPFTKEQEERVFAVLDDPARRMPNRREMRVLFHLGAFTGQRLKDCALLQWHNVNLAQQRISVAQFKTGKEVMIPIAPRLLEVLREAQQWQEDSYVLPNVSRRYLRTDRNGKSTGHSAVNYDIIRVIEWSGLVPSVKVPGRQKAVTVYGFHSLRHSFVSFCIEHNIPKAVTVSILGADSDIIDQYYTHVGEAAQEQAIQLISGNGTTVAQRYDRAVEFLASIPEDEKDARWREMERILRG